MTAQSARRAVFLAAGATLALLMTANAANAQEGPVVVGQRQKPPLFSLYNYVGEAEFLWRQRNDSRDPAGAPKSEFTETRFEESFTLEADGHIYHPNLIELDLAGTFGLTQEETEAPGQSESRDGLVNEYDLNATFLRKEFAPVTAYARRTQDQVNREFGPTLDNTINTYGIIWDIRSRNVPTRFEYFHSEQEQSGLGEDVGDFELIQDTLLWHSEHRPTQSQVITWDYTLSNVSEMTEGFSDNQYILHDANLSYSIDFGPQDRNNFTSSLSYFSQSGDFPIERLRLEEALRLRHTDNFETRYRYTFESQDFNDLGQDRHRAIAGFSHRLYKSLVTTGNVGIEHLERTDDSTSFEYFADIAFDYRKQVPLGTLSSFLSLAFSREENSEQIDPTPVNDLPRVISDAAPILIVGNNIEPASIRVTDASGLIQFQEGADYTVTPVVGGVEIDRVVGGRIANGSTVLVDYVLLPQGENTSTTRTISLGGRYDIEWDLLQGLSLYARYTRQEQDVDAETPANFTPESYNNVRFGAEYRLEFLTFGAEREMHDSTISPYNANRFFARYARRLDWNTTLNLNATYTQIEYLDDDNQVDILIVSGSVFHRLSRELYVVGTVLYHDERDDLRGPTRGFEEQLQLNWSRRQTTVYALVRNSNLETDFQDNSFQLYEIGIRRRF